LCDLKVILVSFSVVDTVNSEVYCDVMNVYGSYCGVLRGYGISTREAKA